MTGKIDTVLHLLTMKDVKELLKCSLEQSLKTSNRPGKEHAQIIASFMSTEEFTKEECETILCLIAKKGFFDL